MVKQLFLCAAAVLAVAFAGGNAFAENNDGERRDEVKAEFRGGHVYFGGETADPATAEASAAKNLPDLIRWVLEHKGVKIARGDVVLSHYTIRNWRTVRNPINGKKVKIPLPNTYRGYLGWKP